jgi:predicted ATPase/DNA-binding SARP family transcriptional activator
MSTEFMILGELQVLQDGGLVQLGSPRQKALLARLLIASGETVSTDRLIDDLWGAEAAETAKHTLHVYVSRLRKALTCDGGRLARHGTGYRFVTEPAELDASRFEVLATEGRAALARHDYQNASTQLTTALGLWRGRALNDFADDAFARDEAVRLDELRLAALEQRIWSDLELGHHADLVVEVQDLAAQHPFRETFWEQLMLALYRCGRQAEALRVFQSARSHLAEELGIEPGPAIRNLEERILSQDPGLSAPQHRDGPAPTADLPLQRTSFVGRERELISGAELLAVSRLLTLTGAPGSGKTRLAVQLAADHADQYAHGTFFVPLAAVTNPRLVGAAIARVLDLHEVPGEPPLDSVKAFLRSRQVLLVLDNFEQILDAGAQVGELLDGAPDLTVLATSRAPLHISGEQEFPVPPLAVPPIDTLPALDDLSAYDAVALFVARSRSAEPSFQVTADNASAIAGITARVDGLPLAIELAAARTKLLSPADLLSRLEKRLTILTTAPSDSADRHRTMRNAIEWSYELLEPDEQRLFRRLGVFTAGFTLQAAEAIAGTSNLDVFEGVDALLTKSLLYRPVTVGHARFSMLEMMREYATDQLVAAGEARETTDRHAVYFAGLAEEVEPQLTKDPGGSGTQQLNAEIHNLRGALGHSLQSKQPDLGLRLASSIWRFWQSSDQLTEGRDWLESLLAQPEASAAARAKGLTALAGLAYWQADYVTAMVRYEEVLTHYRSIGDRANEADTLYSMSLTALWVEDIVAGEHFADEALSIFEDLELREGIGRALCARATVLWWKEDFGAAHKLWVRSLEIAREHEDNALALTQVLGLAALTSQLGDRDGALQIAHDGIAEAMASQNHHMAVWMVDFVAALAASDDPEPAVRLAGAAHVIRNEAGGGMPAEFLRMENARSVAQAILSPEALDAAWASGRSMSLGEAIAEARRLVSQRS